MTTLTMDSPENDRGNQHPIAPLFRAVGRWLAGRVHLHHDLQDRQIEDRGEVFVPFRKVTAARLTPSPLASAALDS